MLFERKYAIVLKNSYKEDVVFAFNDKIENDIQASH